MRSNLIKKPYAPFGKLSQVRDGIAYRHYKRKNGLVVSYSICCDCSLTHLEAIRINKNYLTIYCWRDEAQTKRLRRRKRKRRK